MDLDVPTMDNILLYSNTPSRGDKRVDPSYVQPCIAKLMQMGYLSIRSFEEDVSDPLDKGNKAGKKAPGAGSSSSGSGSLHPSSALSLTRTGGGSPGW